MPRFEIVTMRNHELLFSVLRRFDFHKRLPGNDVLRFLKVTFCNQSPNRTFCEKVV
jgi:hypothetical protein